MEHYHFSATQSHTESYLTDSLDCMHSVELVLASQLTLATYMLLFLRYLIGSTALLESPLKALGVFKTIAVTVERMSHFTHDYLM